METVNISSESRDIRDKWITEKRRSWPRTITIPPSKTCTTGASSDPFGVAIIEDDSVARVLREGTVGNDMAQIITKGAASVWTIVGEMTEAAAKRTVVAHAMVLRMARGMLVTIRAFIL